mmetsp:Transcript_11141/g.46367  ORF Transcript_11141/g.46367 Transcript_11141/m.46367 type:complete len:298 (-) Transcript_11141:1509-2402(-)
MLMNEPLLPASTICFMLLSSLSERCARWPASSRALLSTWLTLFSKLSCIVRPGCGSSCPFCACWIKSFTWLFASAIVSVICFIVALSGMPSPMPMEKPVCSSQWFTSVCVWFRKLRVAAGPCSCQMVCTRPPGAVPIDFLHSMPWSSLPRSMRTCVSPAEKSLISPSRCPAAVRVRLTSGRKRLNTCLPVHSGLGFRMAGTGILPWNSSAHSMMFIMRSFSMKQSLLVMLRHPSRVSCTIPMTGLLPCGLTMQRGTIIISLTSARVSNVCGTCRFISSPSKSALYGEVTDRLRRNVE